MNEGHVVWFNKEKGYGFIRSDVDSRDYFIHWKNIDGTGFKELHGGDHVTFDVGKGTTNKEQALNVQLLKEAVQ